MSSSEYTVGYGKPPQHSRFQKGRSGNPLGRPRGSKNIVFLVARALKKKVTVTVDGTSQRITVAEAIALQLVKKAATGDPRTVMQVIHLQQMAEQLRRSLEQEAIDSLDFEKMSRVELEKVLLLCSSEELWKAAGVQEPIDLQMCKRFLKDKPTF